MWDDESVSRPAPDFDRMYAQDGDPWQVATSWYERRKIAVAAACLSESAYGRALDPACGTGHLVRAVAPRCTAVLACDASGPAIGSAGDTCAELTNVTLEVRRLPYPPARPEPGSARTDGAVHPPARGLFDLLLLSEFLYYLDAAARRAALASLLPLLDTRVEVLAVHWREQPEDGTCSGDHIHEELRRFFGERGFRHQVAHFDEEFVLDVFTRGHDRYSG